MEKAKPVTEKIYTGQKTKEISFPLGGIGSGCIGLSGSGRLVDWEIFNKPNKGSLNGFTHFAVKAESEGKLIDARVLQGDYLPPYTGSTTNSLGHGAARTTLAGLPHFRDVIFHGQYPFARLHFKDEAFPGTVRMTAFNPLIPLNDRDSSIPGAFFEIEFTNTTCIELSYTVCFSVSNPLYKDETYNVYMQENGLRMIQLRCNRYCESEPEYGDITVATDHAGVSLQEYWYRGAWFDGISTFWQDFSRPGKLSNRTYERYTSVNANLPGHQKTEDTCSLAAHIKLKPGSKKSLRYVLTWNFPNFHKYWLPEGCSGTGQDCCHKNAVIWKNYYASLFKNSSMSASYSLENWERLYTDTLKFKDALFGSTLPDALIDAISANISTLKSPTALRLEDGSFYGWEGCHCNAGCCQGSCTHVWNYAYALPFLFPKLERSMEYLDFKYNQREDGRMSFRLELPPGSKRWDFRACADGQFGGVIKAYRNWKISGDSGHLKSIWEEIKKSIEFAWADTNEDKWDADMDGVLEGRQHNTLDMELFGPNSWLNGFYLAALKAGAEMAEFFGEKEKAANYRELFAKGKRWSDENLFNGEYYHQLIDLKDKSVIDRFDEGGSILGISTEQAYWNDERQEIKNQIGEGCGIDQVIAQWHANICGLGEIFDKKQTWKALESIYRNNFKNSFRNYFNPCRIYALDDEAGAVICEWPLGKYKPAVPAPYSEECWSGCEYQVAAHMIQEGLVSEGVEIVKAVRGRFDGENRNPWNEFECGSHYARAMSSFSLLCAWSGFEFDMVNGMLGFNPVFYDQNTDFRYLWSLEPAWGVFEACTGKMELKVFGGCLSLKILRLPFITGRKIISLGSRENSYDFTRESRGVRFNNTINIHSGESLIIQME